MNITTQDKKEKGGVNADVVLRLYRKNIWIICKRTMTINSITNQIKTYTDLSNKYEQTNKQTNKQAYLPAKSL